MPTNSNGESGPEKEGVTLKAKRLRHFRGYWNISNTKAWVEMFVEKHMSSQAIAKEVKADEGTVSSWLKKHGLEIYQGEHRVMRKQPKISAELIKLLGQGPEETIRLIDERILGICASADGLAQLANFCRFLKTPLGVGVEAVAEKLTINKDTVRKWTSGTDQPYLVRVADIITQETPMQGHKLLPMHLSAGGNLQSRWIQVPIAIQDKDDIATVLQQIQPLERTYDRAEKFGTSKVAIWQKRSELFAYALAMMLGDSGKGGGNQKRVTSTNLDLEFTQKQATNERLGEFTCLCINSVGIEMERIQDKAPTGATRKAKEPSAAYRWRSDRSPFLAWMTFVGLGLADDERTSTDQVHMDWIFEMSREFKIRFVQGLADSDGTVTRSEVIITSVPNADFVTKLLRDLGMTTAHTIYEYGKPLRTMVNRKQASTLPIFNEFVQSYRYQNHLR